MKYKIPKYHKDIFGDEGPRSIEEIYKEVFGDEHTDSIEGWWVERGDKRLISMVSLSRLSNYSNDWAGKQHDEYVNNIRKNGITIPLVCRLMQNGELLVIEGHHRAMAAKELGIRKVPVFIMETVDEKFISTK